MSASLPLGHQGIEQILDRDVSAYKKLTNYYLEKRLIASRRVERQLATSIADGTACCAG